MKTLVKSKVRTPLVPAVTSETRPSLQWQMREEVALGTVEAFQAYSMPGHESRQTYWKTRMGYN